MGRVACSGILGLEACKTVAAMWVCRVERRRGRPSQKRHQ